MINQIPLYQPNINLVDFLVDRGGFGCAVVGSIGPAGLGERVTTKRRIFRVVFGNGVEFSFGGALEVVGDDVEVAGPGGGGPAGFAKSGEGA